VRLRLPDVKRSSQVAGAISTYGCGNDFQLPAQICLLQEEKCADLRETDDSERRFCKDCNKPVYLCHTEADFEKRRRAGECVALTP
jgi:hypothetical protein